MRRRRKAADAVQVPTEPAYVEDFVDPTEPPPTMPTDGPRQVRELLRGEPPEAVPWRILAEERVEELLLRSRGPVREALPVRTVRTRGELALQPRDEPAPRPLEEVGRVGLVFHGFTVCVWRDVRAFLDRVA